MHDLVLHPATKALHYAVQLFEGLKAYRGYDGKIRLFRPELNIARFCSSHVRFSFLQFSDEFVINYIQTLTGAEVNTEELCPKVVLCCLRAEGIDNLT